MLLAVVVSVLGAGVEVAVDTPCVEAAFSGRLANGGIVLPPDTTLSLRRVRAEVLEVTLKPRGAAPMRREVPAAARDCAGVERVVMALVKAWLASPVMMARAGRDGGVPSVDGGAVVNGELDDGSSARVDALDGADARVVRAGVDGGATMRAGVDDGGSSPRRADVGGATVRGDIDGGSSPSRADVGGATVRGDIDGGSSPRRADVGGATVRGDIDGGSSPSRADVGGATMPAGVDDGVSSPGRADVTVRAGVDDGGSSPMRADIGGAPLRAGVVDDGGSSPGRADAPLRASVDDGGSSPARADVRVPTVRADVDDGGASPMRADVDGGALTPVSTDIDGGADAPRWSFGAGLLGGIASGTTTDIVPQGLLSVDVTRGWFGAALDVGLSGNVSRQVAPGSVTSSWQWLSLSARAVWAPLRRVSLEAQLGLRAHRIVAFASGYAETKPEQQLLSLGAVGSLGASVFIVGPVGLTVRATGVVKPPERFTIDNLGAVLDLGSLEGAVHAGVVVRW